MSIFYQVIIITFTAIISTKGAISNASHYLEITSCYDNVSFFNTAKNRPRVVDVVTGTTVHLWCQFCESKKDYNPKWWFYAPRVHKKRKNVLTEIPANDFSTKLSITPVHMLNIYDFSDNYSGIYLCKTPEMKEGNVFMYILEGIFNVDVSPKLGTSDQWSEYKRNYFESLNKQFEISEEAPFQSLRDYNITFKLITIWDNWGKCNEIDHQKGVHKRLGRCRLQPIAINNSNFELTRKDLSPNTEAILYLTDGYDIPCRSLQLNKTLPELSKIIRYIPDYEAQEPCHYKKRTARHKINKDKHKTTKQVEENSHVTLLCADAIPNSDLQWLKDAKILNSLFRNNILCKNEEEPHISVDTNNSLHILHISKNEEGNYSCLINGKKVQEFEVRVVSKSKLLNQEFIRYSIYLGFVLSLAMTCYCAGVCVAWHRRSSFVDPLHVNKKGIHEYSRLYFERERLLK